MGEKLKFKAGDLVRFTEEEGQDPALCVDYVGEIIGRKVPAEGPAYWTVAVEGFLTAFDKLEEDLTLVSTTKKQSKANQPTREQLTDAKKTTKKLEKVEKATLKKVQAAEKAKLKKERSNVLSEMTGSAVEFAFNKGVKKKEKENANS